MSVGPRARRRMARREQLAAVLVGNDRDRIGAEPLRLARRSRPCPCRSAAGGSRSVVAPAITVRFSSVCDATWPITSPVTSARARQRARQRLGDPQHQPPIDDHAQLGRNGQHHLLLELAERHEHEARAQLLRRQQRGELAHLFLRGARQNRIAVKVNEAARSSRAASSGTPRPASRCRPTAGTRRVRRCRSAGRRRPAPCRRSRTRGRSASRDESSARRAPRSTRHPFASLMRPPTSRSICGDVSGKRLSARRAHTRNDAGSTLAQVGEDRRRQLVEVERRASGERKIRDAEDAPHAVAHVGPRRSRTRARSRSVPSRIESTPTGEIRQRRAQIAHEQLDEPRPVLPLERELLVVNDDARHLVNWSSGDLVN